jgi:hypothetical protein
MSEFIGLLVVLAIVVFIGYFVESASCSNRAEMMGFPSSYGMMQGCMIHTKSGWVDIDHYRVLQ